MDIADIRRLVKMVESSDIDELNIQDKDFKIRITKRQPGSAVAVSAPAPVIPQAHPLPASISAPAQPSVNGEAAKASGSENLIEICSPMVGTFYRSPAPDAAAYVDTGDEIKPGRVLCIIEAMKLMNELEAEVSGKIVKILAENGQPVEYNQPLFLVEKA